MQLVPVVLSGILQKNPLRLVCLGRGSLGVSRSFVQGGEPKKKRWLEELGATRGHVPQERT